MFAVVLIHLPHRGNAYHSSIRLDVCENKYAVQNWACVQVIKTVQSLLTLQTLRSKFEFSFVAHYSFPTEVVGRN